MRDGFSVEEYRQLGRKILLKIGGVGIVLSIAGFALFGEKVGLGVVVGFGLGALNFALQWRSTTSWAERGLTAGYITRWFLVRYVLLALCLVGLAKTGWVDIIGMAVGIVCAQFIVVAGGFAGLGKDDGNNKENEP